MQHVFMAQAGARGGQPPQLAGMPQQQFYYQQLLGQGKDYLSSARNSRLGVRTLVFADSRISIGDIPTDTPAFCVCDPGNAPPQFLPIPPQGMPMPTQPVMYDQSGQ